MPPMVWIVIVATIAWIAIYVALFYLIDFESEYLTEGESTGGGG